MTSKPKLIQANIALFTGTYPEVRRWLDDLRASGGITPDDRAQVLWLEAQAQDDADERLQRLRALIAQVPSTDPYAQMARQILTDEQEHAAHLRALQSGTFLPALHAWQWIAALILVGAVIVTLVLSASQPAALPNPTATISAALPTAAFADTSRALDPAAYTGRYPQGILQITRVEDASLRVIAAQSGELVNPVDGGRFYALQIAFECRSGVCDQPPEADLALLLDDNTVIQPRSDLSLGGEATLTAVALGRVTTGWVVFEIPLISRAVALNVAARGNPTFDPLSIRLGVTP